MNSKAISVLAEAGLSGAPAETSLRSLLATLAAQTDSLRAVLAGCGLDPSEVDPAHERTVDIIRRLSRAGFDREQAMNLFGEDGAAAYVALAANLQRFEELEGL